VSRPRWCGDEELDPARGPSRRHTTILWSSLLCSFVVVVVVVVVKFIVRTGATPVSITHRLFPSRINVSHFSPPSTVNAISVIEDDCDDDDAQSEDESCAFTRGVQSSSDRRNIQ
jgi:hypothetical protein